MQQKLGITREYLNNPSIDRIKVAVLDYGFEGVDGKRPYLPASTVVIEHYDRAFIVQNQLGDPDFSKPFEPGNTHGRSMAQTIWGITGHRPEGPQFFLLNANGPTLFRRAVRYAMEQRVDIILFSGVFEGAGNGDGRGFLNAAVREAIASGIIWINAAGNYGRRTYEGPVQTTATGELRFPGRPDPNVLRFRNRLDENTVTCTLTWNDYRETEDAGTLKDLDLYIENEKGLIVGSSTLKQITGRQAQAGETRNPRERVQLQDLPAGEYRIKIRTSTPKLWNSLDRFRLLIVASRDEAADPKTGEPIDAVPFLDNNGKGEIYPPADNPLVLTVGDITLASSSGATADHRRKPDILLEDARATFTNGLSSTGASNAAAYLAGMTVLLKAAEPRLSTSDMLALAHPIITKTSTTVRRSLASSPVVPPNALKSSSRLPPLQPTITLNTPGSANRPPFKDPWKMPARQQLHERVNTKYTRSTSL
ncbi:MAG TPA: S8 family serine peptidase, partial [Gemmatales bacterium]|nr:S8 family serine peptidase [Gemmatales bacterium]